MTVQKSFNALKQRGGSRMKLKEITSSIGIGVSLTRARVDESYENKIEFDVCSLLTIMNFATSGNEEVEKNKVFVDANRLERIALSKEGMVLLGLTNGKAMVVEKEDCNQYLTTNIAYIECLESVDPYYLCWYLNETSKVQNQLHMFQNSSNLRMISTSMLRELEIELPTLRLQKTIGKAYQLKLRQNKLLKKKMEIDTKIFNLELLTVVEEELHGSFTTKNT